MQTKAFISHCLVMVLTEFVEAINRSRQTVSRGSCKE